tara:strand:+ start:58 stop:261 length:204 start_codon:yes stop_codon:yes gene_type:complete
MSNNGWSEYQQLVLHRLDEADKSLLTIDNRLRIIEGKVERIGERLAITAAVMGFVAGTVPAIIATLV